MRDSREPFLEQFRSLFLEAGHAFDERRHGDLIGIKLTSGAFEGTKFFFTKNGLEIDGGFYDRDGETIWACQRYDDFGFWTKIILFFMNGPSQDRSDELLEYLRDYSDEALAQQEKYGFNPCLNESTDLEAY